jgi:hypothetical protein
LELKSEGLDPKYGNEKNAKAKEDIQKGTSKDVGKKIHAGWLQ